MNKTARLLLTASIMLVIQPIAALSAAECGQGIPSFSREMVPDRVISYQDETTPEWKKLWDQARKLYNQEKYGQAQVQYEILLTDKDNIDLARWEYVTLLICRKQWQKAGTELSLLTSHDPDRPEYKLARAEIDLARGDFKGAVTIYAPLYAQQCAVGGCTENKARILSGYIRALEGIGRLSTLMPLMEQLARLRPDDVALQQKIAETALKNNQPDKAVAILTSLAGSYPDNLSIMQELARTYKSIGNSLEAAVYWQQVVGLDGGNLEAHEQLIEYYREVGSRPMELKHVELLLTLAPDDTTLLERAARINLGLGRPDKALDYYNWLLSLKPGDQRINDRKDKALEEIAVKLLALIENTGTSQLWQDLVQVTDDRIGVYRKLADMLRTLGRRDALTQVLIVIHNEVPGDSDVANELSLLLEQQGRGDILASSKEMDTTPPVTLHQ